MTGLGESTNSIVLSNPPGTFSAGAPLRMVLGSQALESTLATLRKRIAGFEAQTALAASTDFPPGE